MDHAEHGLWLQMVGEMLRRLDDLARAVEGGVDFRNVATLNHACLELLREVLLEEAIRIC